MTVSQDISRETVIAMSGSVIQRGTNDNIERSEHGKYNMSKACPDVFVSTRQT